MGGMTSKGRVDLSGMDRSFFEALSPEARVELLCRLGISTLPGHRYTLGENLKLYQMVR